MFDSSARSEPPQQPIADGAKASATTYPTASERPDTVVGGDHGRRAGVEELERPRTGLMSAPALDAVLYRDGILANGSRGYEVKVVQTALNRAGIELRGGADGHYGPATRNAVMRFQRENGLIPTGILDRETVLKLDKTLQELGAGRRQEALPALRPLRGVPASYLISDAERACYDAVCAELQDLRDRGITAPQALVEDLVAILDRLEALPPASYANVLRALAATREVKNPFAPTALDLLLGMPALLSDDVSARERLCAGLVQTLSHPDVGGVHAVLDHVSPDSVGRLDGAPSFARLRKLLG